MSGIQKINIAIIGNNFGKKVHLPAFQTIPNVNIVGVYSSKDNIGQIICNSKLDALTLAVPPIQSYDILKLAIENDKHIFCEKPSCANFYLTDMIVDLLNDHDILTMVNFELIQVKAIKELKKIIETNVLGAIKSFNLVWKVETAAAKDQNYNSWKLNVELGGGALLNFGTHIFHLIEWLFNEQIIDISGKILPKITYNTKIEASVKFPTFNGAISLAVDEFTGFVMEIVGENGTAKLENTSNNLKNFSLSINDQQIYSEADLSDKDGRIDLVNLMAQQFINGIITQTAVRPDIEDDIRAQQIAMTLKLEAMSHIFEDEIDA